jgi:hypothetical protein
MRTHFHGDTLWKKPRYISLLCMKKTHIKPSAANMFIMPQRHRPLYTESEVLYIFNHHFLGKNLLESLIWPYFFLNFWAQLKKWIKKWTSVQAAWWNGSQVGLWISRLGWAQSSGWSIHFSGFLLPPPRSLRSFMASAVGWEDHDEVEFIAASFGLSWNPPFHFHEVLLTLCVSQSHLSRFLSPLWREETLQRIDHFFVPLIEQWPLSLRWKEINVFST